MIANHAVDRPEGFSIKIKVSWQGVLAFPANGAGNGAEFFGHVVLLRRFGHARYLNGRLRGFTDLAYIIARMRPCMQWPLRDDHGMENWQRIALGCGGAMFVAMGLGRFSYGAMIPALVQSGQVSIDQAGWVGGINLAGFSRTCICQDDIKARSLQGVILQRFFTIWAIR